MQQGIAEPRAPSNGVLSDETTTAILDTYLRLHGRTTEARLTAVVQSATEAATALVCFQMVMRGDLVPELAAGGVVYRNAEELHSTLEPIGPIVRRVLTEVSV